MECLFFDIKRYAINDGPGIRTTVFLKGCPLSCLWCHNPEGISPRRELMYSRKKCLTCQSCIRVCPKGALVLDLKDGIVNDKEKCTLCGACTDICPSRALEMSGKHCDTDTIIKEIEKETMVMDQSGGGVTFCGGEPLMHPEALRELLIRCGQSGIHRAVDTTLFCRPETLREIMPHTDLFLVDLKHMDSAKHQYYCGVPNERILSNLRILVEEGKEVLIRIPLIEGVNADEENLTDTAAFLSTLPWQPKKVNLLLYHDIGQGKHEKLGTHYNPDNIPMSTPSEETQQKAVALFRQYGIEAVVGG